MNAAPPPDGPTSRPRLLVVVTGTRTEVGKTWVGSTLLGAARRAGRSVAVRKPAQSFSPSDRSLDADVLARAAGLAPGDVCPAERGYPAPMAPPMAAAALGREPFTIADLAAETAASWPRPAADLALVEGAGGVASPLAADGDTADLARALGADLAVVVAEPVLGVLGEVRLAVAHLHPIPVVVHLNRFDPADDLHRRNLDWLRGREDLTVTCSVAELLEAVAG